MFKIIKSKGLDFFFSNSLFSNLISSYANAVLSFIYNSAVLYILNPKQWGVITSILVFKDLALNINLGETEYLRKNFLHSRDVNLLNKTVKISVFTVIIYAICFISILSLNLWMHIGINEVIFLILLFSFDYLQYTPTNLFKSIGHFHALKVAYLIIPVINILTLPLVYFFTVSGFFISKILSSFIALIILYYLFNKKIEYNRKGAFTNVSIVTTKQIIATSSLLQFINIGMFLINAIPKFILPTKGNSGVIELGYFSFALMLMMPFNQFISISNEFFYNKSNKSLLAENSINLHTEILNFVKKLTALFLLYPIAETILLHFFFENYKRDFLYFFNIVGAIYFQGFVLILLSMVITLYKRKNLYFVLCFIFSSILIEAILFYLKKVQILPNSTSIIFLITNSILLLFIIIYLLLTSFKILDFIKPVIISSAIIFSVTILFNSGFNELILLAINSSLFLIYFLYNYNSLKKIE